MLKKILITAGAAAATLASGLALANPPYWAPAHGWRAHQDFRPAYRPVYRPYYVTPRPVVVMPAPRYVYAYPRYAAPVVVQPAPAYPVVPGVSIRLHFPL